MKGKSLEDDSFCQKFIKDENDLVTATSRYLKRGHERKKIQNCEYIDIVMDNMASACNDLLENGLKLHKIVEVFVSLIKNCFNSFGLQFLTCLLG